MKLFNVIDLETTGFDPPEAEVIEVAVSALFSDQGDISIYPPKHELFSAANGIGPESRAIHHISMAQVDGKPLCGKDDLARIALQGGPQFLVSHNADFEKKWFTPEVVGSIPWICTYKCALRLWPDAPRHGNQVLRYWLEDQGKIPVLGRRADPAHRAGPDTTVTAYLLSQMLGITGASEMVQWSSEPRLIHRLTFGKHRGLTWPEVPSDYLSWLIDKGEDEDVKWNARREVQRRRAS